jgi:hypothetical protein
LGIRTVVGAGSGEEGGCWHQALAQEILRKHSQKRDLAPGHGCPFTQPLELVSATPFPVANFSQKENFTPSILKSANI